MDNYQKKAIVIGATSGIGKELAKVLSKNGYVVGITGRRLKILAEMQNEMNTKTFIKQMDLVNIDDAITKLKELIEEIGGIELLIISSGVYYSDYDLIWENEKNTIDVNVLGFTAMANVAFNHFLRNKSGHIVGLSSVKANRGGGKATVYNASKSFVSNYLEGLRKKAFCKCRDIYITTIESGPVETPMYEGRKKSGILTTSTNIAANLIFKAIISKKNHAYITRRWVVLAWLYKNMPFFLYKRL